jgi:pyruvate,orthophosphate dikinase
MAKKYVYLFEEGRADMRNLLGGKGANLCEMNNIGLPVPPGFVITTEMCHHYYEVGKRLPEDLLGDVAQALKVVEQKSGKKFGSVENPLLVSVRSGAPVSMPGMMDTILNLGINDQTVEGMAKATNNPRFAWDCYRRFIQMFGNVVMDMEHAQFEKVLEGVKEEVGAKYDTDMDVNALKEVVKRHKELVRKTTGTDFPQDPVTQLHMAIEAVFASWNNDRAIVYRRLNHIPDSLGTAVCVVTMVYGNMGNDSGTGVVFTRDVSTGEPGLNGEYLMNAQGEDVVAGIRTPKPVAQLEQEQPEVYQQLLNVGKLLEKHFKDVQDMEFTVEHSKLYMLQTRNAKRTAAASVRIAFDMVGEGLIDKKTAVLRVDPEQVDHLLHKTIDPKAAKTVLTVGLPASPGAGSGKVIFSADEAERRGQAGEKVILVRNETTPDDIHGIIPAQGILTAHGGKTSHAAIVARGMGKPCVSGAENVKIDVEKGIFTVDGKAVKEGEVITIDGSTGEVMLGEVGLVQPKLSKEFEAILSWAEQYKRLGVEANADTPEDAQRARQFGATGVGLCRTEHMFMQVNRLPVVQEMILAEKYEDRKNALDRLLPFQQGDFEGILRAMDGLTTTIRLLDPPLHEFLPKLEVVKAELAELRANHGPESEITKREDLIRRINQLHEANPMLGFRGCRLAVVYPEIYEMQARAIFQATVTLVKEGLNPKPEVMIPIVGFVKEIETMRALVEKVHEEVEKETGVKFEAPIGTMIELPRAALIADEIAQYAEFFSFGTNDLTQTTLGFSRDDAEGKFLPVYIDKKIVADNPFASLDVNGVGKLVELGVKLGRKVRPDMHIGICGEHGGDPRSVEFCHKAGLTYVSCSPFRVPVARIAAAHAALKEEMGK